MGGANIFPMKRAKEDFLKNITANNNSNNEMKAKHILG